jgi:hypothetical protein
MRPEIDKALRNILDTMTGTDGGIRFVNLKCFLEEFDKKAVGGDNAARQVINVPIYFSNLIDIANREGEARHEQP